MSKFYSILLDDEMHDDLKRRCFETKEPISALVRRGIRLVLKNSKCNSESKKHEDDNKC